MGPCLSPLELVRGRRGDRPGAAPVPFDSSVVLATEALKRCRLGGRPQKTMRCRLASRPRPEAIGTLAVAEGPAAAQGAQHQHDLRRRPAQRQEGAGGPTARPRNVPVVLTKTSLVLVELAQKAVNQERVETIDPARKHCELTLTIASPSFGAPRAKVAPARAPLRCGGRSTSPSPKSAQARKRRVHGRDYALQRQAFRRAMAPIRRFKHKL